MLRNSLGGEHATMVHGNGMNPGMDDVIDVARQIGLDVKKAKKIATEIKECVECELKCYLK